jgi:trigger factor
LAELNQELFDKLFGAEQLLHLTNWKKIKEDAEANLLHKQIKKLLGDVTDFLIESTKFDLPAEFLKNGYKQ